MSAFLVHLTVHVDTLSSHLAHNAAVQTSWGLQSLRVVTDGESRICKDFDMTALILHPVPVQCSQLDCPCHDESCYMIAAAVLSGQADHTAF